MRKVLIASILAAVAIQAAPVLADPPGWAPAHGRRAQEHREYDRYGRYAEPRRLSENDRVWRGRDGRWRCRRDNGTTGLIVGGVVGAMIGREIDGGRDRSTGTILGAAGGALLGREIDRSNARCR